MRGDLKCKFTKRRHELEFLSANVNLLLILCKPYVVGCVETGI
jgi:hypothetical protein